MGIAKEMRFFFIEPVVMSCECVPISDYSNSSPSLLQPEGGKVVPIVRKDSGLVCYDMMKRKGAQ